MAGRACGLGDGMDSTQREQSIVREASSGAGRGWLGRFVALVGLLVLVGLFLKGNSAGAQVTCAAGQSPYAMSDAMRTACSVESYPLASKTTITTGLTAGATAYKYVADGTPIEYLVPPASFDAATASADLLKAYGIPAAPPTSDTVAWQNWSTMVHNFHFVVPPATLMGVPHAGDTGGSANSDNSHWAGIVNTGVANDYVQSAAIWIEPPANPTSCHPNSAVFWNGLGSRNGGNDLAQNGTAINSLGLGQHQGWLEVLPQLNSYVAQNIFATEGAQFLTGTVHDSGNTFQFVFYNYATGKGMAPIVTANGYDGSSAEYIAERPLYGNDTFPGLTDFGGLDFIETETNGIPSNSYFYTGVTMKNGADTLAVPHNYGGNGVFNIAWNSCL
ncbi:MAG: hypothetical protein M3Y09_14600 [Actinomycetota bacterium]|nr:hypothetical protein [Actinomycetota bacterium]